MRLSPWLPVLLSLLVLAPAVRAEGDDPVGAALRGLSGEKALRYGKALAAEQARARKRGIAVGDLVEPWLSGRMSAAGLERGAPGGTHLVPFTHAGTRGHNVLGVIPGKDPKLEQEIILLGARADPEVDDASGAAVLLHLAEVLTANEIQPRRRIVFCAFSTEGKGFAGAAALAARLPLPGRVVAMLHVDDLGHGEPVPRIDGVGAYPSMKERLEAFLGADRPSKVTFGLRASADGDHWPFHERGIPAFPVTRKGAHSKDQAPADEVTRATNLEAAARLVGTLAVQLADHPEPLTDPLGVAGYLIREGPRVAVDSLLTQPDGSMKLARTKGHARGLRSGLSALAVTVSEDQDPAAAWKAIEAFEAAEGPVRFRFVRRVDDIRRAYAEGRIALIPRLCCARAAHADPTCLKAYAALGYRWIAPWASGTRRKQEPCAIEPIVAAARPLKVILDACDLPNEHHTALRAALGDSPALYLPNRGVQPGAELGPLTLPFVRFRRGASWQKALALFPGLAPAIFYAPRGERLGQAIATWGAKQPAGWDTPGSPQRQAIRGALGGYLLTWLERAEQR